MFKKEMYQERWNNFTKSFICLFIHFKIGNTQMSNAGKKIKQNLKKALLQQGTAQIEELSEKEKSGYLAVISRVAALLLEKNFQNIFKLLFSCVHFNGAFSGLHRQLCWIYDSTNIDNTHAERGQKSFISPLLQFPTFILNL